ncbi:MAG TPA: DUF1801 domain-containing protein [Candidatus Nanopelagicales bacterium]|nr:DUF1801 domain-containing protein [Candidatus Nanopelagicales bacterium]
MNSIDDYLAAQPEPQRSTLADLRTTISALLPRAEESIAYGAPAWKVDGTSVAGFAAFAQHCAYLPFSGAVTETLGDALAAYTVTKGSVTFPVDTPLPKAVVKKLVAARLAEISMAPDRKGAVRDFYADGGLKAAGRMKDGELHGAWSWWRKDGSLMRTGSFDRGRQVGAWTTYDAAGDVVTTKQL